MKTRERILQTALALFNREGEPHVTTVDIANELNISPGNLYYHFKGKDLIIAELYRRYEKDIAETLRAPMEGKIDIQDSWFYVYVVFEQLYHVRFFYHNLTDILQRNPLLARQFQRLLQRKYDTARELMTRLVEHQVLCIDEQQRDEIAENIALVLTHWLNHARIRKLPDNEVLIIHRGVFQLMSLIAPYLSGEYRHLYQSCRELYQHLLEAADAS